MIRIYTHRDENDDPVSIHELHKKLLYPSSDVYQNGVSWTTKHFVQVIEALPHSKQYFEFCNWHQEIPISQQGYYLLYYGSSQSIVDNTGFIALPPEVRDQINDGTLTLLVVFTSETFDTNVSISVWQSNFCRLLSVLGITRHKSVKVLMGASSKIMLQHLDPRVTWIYYPWFEAALQVRFHRQYATFDQIPKYNPSSRKQYKFLSLNKAPRDHRIIMTAMLEFFDIAKHGYISWPSWHDRLAPITDRKSMFATGIKQHRKFENFILENQRITGTYHDSASVKSGEWMGATPLCHLAEFELINETHHHNVGDFIFLTEKTFRTLASGMPFLLFGNPGSLSLLHQLGYKTFAGVFDESYDQIYAPVQSVEFIAGQVHKMCIDSSALHSQEVTDIVNFNQTHFWTKMHAPEIWKAIVHGNG